MRKNYLILLLSCNILLYKPTFAQINSTLTRIVQNIDAIAASLPVRFTFCVNATTTAPSTIATLVTKAFLNAASANNLSCAATWTVINVPLQHKVNEIRKQTKNVELSAYKIADRSNISF